MIKSIRLTKTPTKNSSTLLKQIDKVDQSILTPLLESHLLGEGVYGFESVTNCDATENFLVIPSLMRNMIGKESYRDYRYLLNSFNHLHCYHIVQEKPSFLPLYVAEPTSLIQQFQLLQSDTNEIYVQFLFSKRSDVWQYELIDQYKAYMDGNDWPSPTKTGRKVQEKMLNVIIKLGNFDMKRQEIEEISQKILENGYRFQLKVVIYEENQEKLHKIELEMEEILKEMDFFNQLGVMKSRNKKQFMERLFE